MPSVAVLTPSPAVAGFGYLPSKMQNGSSAPSNDIVAEIKNSAKEQALNAARGASNTGMLHVATSQFLHAKEAEDEGNLKEALASLTKATVLLTSIMNSREFKQKVAAVYQPLVRFQQEEGADLAMRMKRIEEKLAKPTSVAERIGKLQHAGLDVSPVSPVSKRVSKDFTSITSPSLTDAPLPTPNRISLPPPLPTSSALASPAAPSSKLPSPHTLIPASSFGPPSPVSEPPESPLDIAGFEQNFPSIDELDRLNGSVQLSSTSNVTPMQQPQPTPLASPTPSFPAPTPAFPIPRPAFPVLPLDPGPRPSSTPIPSTIDTFVSRPSSPAGPGRSPLSPTVPRKPSNLSLNHKAQPPRSPLVPTTNLAPTSEKRELPFTALFPKVLYEYKQKPGFKVLLLDTRKRADFEREHIKSDAIVCIEPDVLLRESVTADSIEDSLYATPMEGTLFSNRDKFDLVAIYDENSETPSASPAITALQRSIYEHAFKKILRNIPMLLIGGLKAWKAEFGPEELVRGGTITATEVITPSSNLPVPTTSPGMPSPQLSGLGISGMQNTIVSASASSYSTGTASTASSPRGPVSVSLHARTGAESIASSVSPPTLPESLIAARNRSRTDVSPEPVYKMWIPPADRADTPGFSYQGLPNGDAKENVPLTSPQVDPSKRLSRKPAISRPPSNSVPTYTPPIPEHAATHHVSSSHSISSTPIQYPQFASRTISPQISGSSFNSSSSNVNAVSLPPQASINPSPLSRRRSDYIDQSQEALSGITNKPLIDYTSRPTIDYPSLSTQQILRPPPAAAPSSMERQDNRPRILPQQPLPKPPTIQSDYPVTYWADVQVGTSGLKNLGNTCYMNSTIQCLSATVPFARFFTDGRWKAAINMVNPMGTHGHLAAAFASILRDMWQNEMQTISPVTFRRSICHYASQFSGTEQHDSQEFLQFLLDGLHEDLNRVLNKPVLTTTAEREEELERLATPIASEQEWQLYRMRNDSLVVDLFQGQFRNRLECLTCHKTSTTYNTFMYLTLPIPNTRGSSRISLQQCLDAFVKEEVMEKSDAWHCPNCKTLRRATKRLSLSRLPPVLLVHLKRFSHKGHFTDKIETFVDFPMRGLDLTNYMPSPLPPALSKKYELPPDDPRAQIPPYRYDLYAVTNHFGTLSSGHYTAFISSRGGWLYCDDSRISLADPKDVVGKPAYVLYYKRTRS